MKTVLNKKKSNAQHNAVSAYYNFFITTNKRSLSLSDDINCS